MQASLEIQHTSLIEESEVQKIHSGKHYRLFEKLGSHITKKDGVKGCFFAVWAPNAKRVSVIGDFNDWNGNKHPLFPRWDGSGIWEGFLPEIGHGSLYKYQITAHNGSYIEKSDPFANFCERPPQQASIVWDLQYQWGDAKWLKKRKEKKDKPQPFSVYEVHLGSWRKKDGKRPLTYREHADQLVSYVKDMGFTHVEFMPLMEYPYDPSWGYQVTGFYAPTSRFGIPQDFMYLIDRFHQEDIGVILDWVPSHFPTDGHGLSFFDGTHLYDHADPRKGFHPDWKTCIFNYGRPGVRDFLISNAIFWMEKYHIDGIRVDAVASMLYLDYSRDDGEWVPNIHGGNENLEAISFLKELNEVVYGEFPDIVTIAEESTSWPGVSRPTYDGGLGFGQKWMMGWMHDNLNYFKRNPIYRRFHQNDITFSMVYAFSENFMLPLSHDEVVHGKGSLINRMPGDEWQSFANLRLLYGFMFTHPGTKLLFMGSEIAQTAEWNFRDQINWWLLQYEVHSGIQNWVKALNAIYTSHPALFEKSFSPDGFEWIAHDDYRNSVIVFIRKGSETVKPLLVACNFTPAVLNNYQMGISYSGSWKEILNSDAKEFGGSNVLNEKNIKPEKSALHGRDYTLSVTLPPLGITVLEPLRLPKVVKKKVVAKKSTPKKAPATKQVVEKKTASKRVTVKKRRVKSK